MLRCSLLMLLGLVVQPGPITPPIEGRPDDFSNIVGDYTIDISAAPLAVAVNEPITLQVQIRGVGPAQFEPQRKYLHVLPDWERLFHVEPVPDEDRVLRDKNTWLFVYRLRPKVVKVNFIDGVRLACYDPKSRKYETRYADPVKIVVKPQPDEPPNIVAKLEAPESFWRLDEGSDVLTNAGPAFSPAPWHIAVALLVPPLVCLGGFLAWRQWHPDDARERARRRRHAAQTALANLRANRTFAWVVVREYLYQRFAFAVDDPTPDDVADFLKRRGFAIDRCNEALVFFRSCDAIRFAQGTTSHEPLSDAASRLIETLEADPCAR